jgi:hypothetical protein
MGNMVLGFQFSVKEKQYGEKLGNYQCVSFLTGNRKSATTTYF